MDFAMNWRKDSLTAKNVFKNMGVSNRYELHWNQALKAIDNNQVNAWDWQWYFSLSKQNQLCIFPATNLIENIGFGENATHTKGVAKKRYLETKELRFPLSHPSVICPDFRYDMKFEQTKMSSRRRICLQKTKALLKFIVDFISD
ncbi:hypothetical protein DN745_18100 [Bradymonas sediminis]|uniref:Uncharacterized protein n=2 Tax=Bradymonas sediminis TaxID=1548548 RepID=A0A2Z4FR21_9DELT|nr:hypothetical protein DN745_18100 [Bradymonas sediminis]